MKTIYYLIIGTIFILLSCCTKKEAPPTSLRTIIDGYVHAKANAWAEPNYSPSYSTIFYGQAYVDGIVGNDVTVSIKYMSPLDNIPGGSYYATQTIAAADPGHGGDIKSYADWTCFVPVISALDINTTDYNYNVHNDANIHSKTPFADIFYYPINFRHMYIDTSLRSWFIRQIVPDNVTIDGNNIQYRNKGIIRAGKSIVLKPGAKATGSSGFHAIISPMVIPASLKSASVASTYSSPGLMGNDAPSSTEVNTTEINNVIVSVFPNPFSANINFSCSKGNIDKIEIMDITGKILYTLPINSPNFTTSFTKLAKGIYIAMVYFGTEVKQFKISKL